MKTKCPRCLGSKSHRNVICVKCGGKGYLTKEDLKIILMAKTFGKKKARKGISLPNIAQVEIKKITTKTLTRHG
jgi:hypothetical protein